MRTKMSQNPIITTAFFAIITSLGGWIFLYIGLKSLREARDRQEAERVRATARVVAYNSHKYTFRTGRGNARRNKTTTVWKPVMEFSVGEKVYRFESKEPFDQDEVPVGSNEEVLYDPDDPSHFHLERIGSQDYRIAWSCIIFGIAIFVFAFFATKRICRGLW